MMGASHAISGAAVFLAVTSPSPGIGVLSADPLERIAGAIVCAGAALLPDADHPNATISYSVPGGSLVTGTIGAATGGHRKGLHSLLAVAAVIAGSVLLSRFTFTPEGAAFAIPVGSGIMAACCVAFAAKVLTLARSWFIAWVVGLGIAAAMTWFFPSIGTWLLAAISIGYAVHLVGDFITAGGVPWLWPWMPMPPRAVRDNPVWSLVWRPGGAFAFPVLGKTGSWREQLLAFALAGYAVWAAVASFIG